LHLFSLASSKRLDKGQAVEYNEQTGNAKRLLAPPFPSAVGCMAYAIASGQQSIGHAAKHLLLELFTAEDLAKGGIEALDQEKIAALVGECCGCSALRRVLTLFFFRFST
jgi:hypothetical protein